MKRAHIKKLRRSLVCFPVFILCLAAITAYTAEWPMFQLDARHSANNTEDFIRLPLENLWQFENGADSFGFSSAIQASSAVYAAFSNGKLAAFDKSTGALLWSVKVDGVIHSAPLYHNDIVYFATSDGTIYALGASDGKMVWVYSAGAAINTSPVVYDNLIFTASNNGMLYALKVENGELAWKTDLGNDYIRSSPAADQSRVYAAALNGNIFALGKLSGDLLWKINIQSQIGSAPSVDGQTLFIGSYDGKIRALRAQDGAIIWTYDVGSPANMALAISSDAVHAVSRDGQIYALAKSNGSLLWKLKMDAPSYSAPTIIGDKLLAGANDKNLYTLMVASGAFVSKTPLAAKVLSPVALSRGKAAFLSDTSGLYLLKSPNQPPLPASDLKVDGKSNLALNSSVPIFTWFFRDNDPDDKQGAFILQIASESLNFSAPVFDSDIAFSANAVFTLDKLLPDGKYFWRVKNFDLFEDFGDFTPGDDFFVLDRTAPKINISLPIADSVYVATKDTISVSFAVTDNLDPASKVTAMLTQIEDRGSPRGNMPANIVVTDRQLIEPLDIDDGIWRLTVSATDFADNAAYLAGGAFEVIHDVLPPRTEQTVAGGPVFGAGGTTYITGGTELKLSSIDDLVELNDGMGLGVKRQRIGVGGLGLGAGETNPESRVPNPDLVFENPEPEQGEIFASTFTFASWVLADGVYYLDYNAEDVLGNVEAIKMSTVALDNTPPVTTHYIGSPYYAAGGVNYITPATPTSFTAADPVAGGVASGVSRIEVSIDGASFSVYAAALKFAEGRHTIKYRAVDNVGNMEAERVLELRSDATPPVTVHHIGSLYYVSAEGVNYITPDTPLTFSATDPITMEVASGVERIETAMDGRAYSAYTAALKFPEGRHTIKYRAYDNVGDIEAAHTLEVQSDATAPESRWLAASGLWVEKDGKFYFNAADSIALESADPVVNTVASGVEGIYYGIDAVAANKYAAPFGLAEGVRIIKFSAKDNVGNTEVVKSTVIYVDGTKPVTELSLSGDQYKGDRQYVSLRTDIIITAEDPVVNDVAVGVKTTGYRVEGTGYSNEENVYTSPFKLNSGGKHIVSFHSADHVSNVETVKTAELWADAAAPVTALTISGVRYSPPGDGTIYLTKDSAVVLTAVDPVIDETASGVLITKYKIGGAGAGGSGLGTGNWQIYNGSFTIPAEGLYTLEYYSLDRVQNAEQLKTAGLAVDNTPPVTAISIGEPKFEVFGLLVLTPDTPMTLSAFDPVSGDVVSGLNSIYYELEDPHTGTRAQLTAYLEPFRLAQGAFIIRYWSKDNVSNAEIPKEIRVSVTPWREDGLIAVLGLEMSGTADISGTVKSNAVVSVSGNARILGDVTASTITVSGKAQITGQKVSGAAPVHPEPVYMAAITESAKREAEKANSAIPKDYLIDGKLVVTSKAGLILSTGTYYFKGLEFAGGSSITVAGKVDILVVGGIKISGGSSVNAGGAASNLNIFASTTSTVDFTGGANFLACLYAPYSHMKLAGNAVLGGHYFAKTAAVSGTSNFIQSGESLPQVVIVTADNGGKKKVSALGTEVSPKVLAGPDTTFRLGEVYVFPNPAKGAQVPTFHIECGVADKVTIKIYTISGRPAHEHTITGAPAVIDDGKGLSYAYEYIWRGHIPSGVYYYYIEAEKAGKNLKKTGKFAVVR